MPRIVNALQLKRGAKVDRNRMGTLTQPIQFLTRDEKDEEWVKWNADWFEMQGLKQIKRNARRLLKNYKLANGIIDKSDYIVEEDNDYADLVDVLTKEDTSALELKFFPIIPNVINVLIGEFAKRNDKITYRAVDNLSYNEMLDKKYQDVEKILVQKAEQKMIAKMKEMGLEPESEEAQQMLSPENLRSLPETERFYKKDYRSIIEEWASHQHNVDEERFKMNELETTAFKDMLIADREFWHFDMREDDYEIELWNPLTTFYHKSPQSRYISQSNFAGNIQLMTVADVIDCYGWQMTKEQIESLESIYPVKAAGYVLPGLQNDGSFYDATRSYEWNTQVPPSLAMRQFTTINSNFVTGGDDVIASIFAESEDYIEAYDSNEYLRVSKIYWKSQRMVGHLTKIDEEGFVNQLTVDENYKVTVPGVYDTVLSKKKDAESLIYGEHIDWFWINQTWGVKKIGPNRPMAFGATDADQFEPIYLGGEPVRYQFKGDFTLYGCKIPVEGAVFSDRNTKSTSLVDKMKPYQIGFNLVNNQIADILIDELGTIIMLDQNALPKHSMGEDWGANNYANAYVAMKNFQILPLDTTITNTENPLAFQHYQVLNLEQTNRLMGRVQLANHFKMQAFDSIGLSPQRMGAVNAQETATGVEQAINMSYSQTEIYFTQHSEYLMPRVHQMRTDLAQYYHSTNPSVRLTYMTSLDEKINFQINGTELLMRDINVFCTSRVNHKQLLEQIKQLALTNNTAGASIYDLGNIMKSTSLAEVDHTLKGIDQKMQQQRQEEMAQQQSIEKMKQEEANKRQEQMIAWEKEKHFSELENNIEVAELKGAGYQTGDLNENNQSDYLDSIKYLDDKRHKEQTLHYSKERDIRKDALEREKLNLSREDMRTRKEIAEKQLQVARENKNVYDTKKSKKK